MTQPKLPVTCPSCATALSVTQLSCGHCGTAVSGNYTLPLLLQLSEDDLQFVLQFFMTGGSLKEMASQMGNSYPTVRNKLDDIIERINQLNKKSNP
ncbi:hypothetical protein HYN48_06865 [Flavobacterium magnum]|uniref:DUF2089 domain-containing protein n=1 Tax=Flavobacterium magnum TaxID=2162713 RepID=A0A2S0RE71_9FLAO|nr:DUF2089 family protein [Flavobacterium magnum]AWA29819.1 hypothetical protein HYN48_06865 [Flavobacterium magnum]